MSKMAFGCLCVALANLVMALAATGNGPHSAWWLVGYFALSKCESDKRFITRGYYHDWQATASWPLLRLEAAVTGQEVWAGAPHTTYVSDGKSFRRRPVLLP